MILLSNEQVIKLGAAVTYFPSNGAIDVGVAVTGELGLVVKLVKIWPTIADWFALTEIDGMVVTAPLDMVGELSTN